MFGIGLSEIVIVALAVIIFVRPQDLPKFLRTLGRLYGKAKRAYNELVSAKDRLIREMETAPETDPPAAPRVAPPDPAAESRPDAPEGASPE